ncbi:hypothetical protein Tco_0173492 [Tanacetum coccineum]
MTQFSTVHLYGVRLKWMVSQDQRLMKNYPRKKNFKLIVILKPPPDVYSLVNHHKVAKEIWDRVKLLMKGMELSQQERECKLYNEFDRSSRFLRYAKSRPNGKLIYNSIMNGPYVGRMIPEPGDADREVPVNETFHEQTDDELIEKELKQVEANDQAIQTMLLGLPEGHLCRSERFTSTDRESIESYNYRFSKLMNDFKRNKHFPEKIASNLKFLNNLQPEWKRHVENGLIVVPGIANPNANQNGNGNVVAAHAEGNSNRNNSNQIRCYNCIGMGHLARNSTVRPMRRDAAY